MLATLTAASLLAAASSAQSAPASPKAEFLDAFAITDIETVGFNDWGTGGLSGIDYAYTDASKSPDSPELVFNVVSDDRAEFDPCRIGTVCVTVADGRMTHVGPLEWEALTDDRGLRFSEDHADPEGVRAYHLPAAPGGDHGEYVRVWSSEGRTSLMVPPAVFVIREDGTTDRIQLPATFMPDAPKKSAQSRGVRNNRGFEALTLVRDADGKQLIYAGVEEPLAQDESEEHRVCRVLVARYVPERPDRSDSHRVLLYPLGPTPEGWDEKDNGLSELLWLSPGRLLSLERAEHNIDDVPHYNIRLYLVSDEDAANLPGGERLADVAASDLPATMTKRLLLDFDTIANKLPGGRPMNFEGMTIVPWSGRGENKVVLIVSDNDHGVEGPTVFVALKLPADIDK